MKTDTRLIVRALRILAADRATDEADTIREAADRLESHHAALAGVRYSFGQNCAGSAYRIVMAELNPPA